MNCRPGDLAIIVKSVAGNEGKIVRCIRLLPSGSDKKFVFDGPRWVIDRPVPDSIGLEISSLADCALRPIRDNDGEDEMLRITGKPQEISALKRVV